MENQENSELRRVYDETDIVAFIRECRGGPDPASHTNIE